MKNFSILAGDEATTFLEKQEINRNLVYEEFKKTFSDDVYPLNGIKPTYEGSAKIWDDEYNVYFYIIPNTPFDFAFSIHLKDKYIDKWVLMKQNFNENCDMDYTDTKVDIDTFGKCLTSLVLNFQDYHDNFIIRSLCGQIADKMGCVAYYRVLD
jgi:hypothetical protein